MAGLIRLGHPFPSILDGLVVVAVAIVAGAPASRSVLLGVAMTSLQVAIGALNDVVDAPRDAGRKPGKPIPREIVSMSEARSIVVVASAAGVTLAAASSAESSALLLAALSVLVLAIGWTYDLAAKGTPWSWLPFAVGIPMLPVFGWLGGSGALPPAILGLMPIGFLAGGGLAIANALADVERDRTAGVGSIADHLGPERAWAVHAVLLAAAALVAIAWLAASSVSFSAVPAVLAGIAVVVVGVVVGRSATADRRERAWQLEAVGVAVVAVGWLLAVTGPHG